MKKTALNEWHRAQGGQMVEFGGWELPVSYSSLSEEHHAVRRQAGLFDISHMGQIEARGASALDFLQSLTSNDVSRLQAGQMQYSTLPAPDGTLLDDIIVSKIGEGRYFVVVNAANAESDFAWMRQNSGRFPDLQLEFLPRAMFALQGPASQAILAGLTGAGLDALKYYHLAEARVAGAETLLSRSGYTGEDGFEICLGNADAPAVWEALMEAGKAAGLRAIGLGARNTLRLEMGYALYGHEIDRTTHPLEAGLGWVVKLDKGAFTGREALLAARAAAPRRALVGFEMQDKGIGRDGYAVVDGRGQALGRVTSGAPSPTLGRAIGMAYVPADLAKPGCEILVQVRERALRARVVPRPFVPPKVRKN